MTSIIQSSQVFNKEYSLEVSRPPSPCQIIESDDPFNIVALSLVRNMEESFEKFKQDLETEINNAPLDTLLIVLPEYCWRLTPPKEVFAYIEELKLKIPKELTLVLGTLEFTLNGKYTNNCIILHNKKLWFVPKTKILKSEVESGLVRGENPGVIQLPRFKLAALVCADL